MECAFWGANKKKSATDAVLQLVETVSSNFDQSKENVAIFLDLVSISHNIFLGNS